MYQKFLKMLIWVFSLILCLVIGLSTQQAAAESVLRVKIMSAVKQVDPIWTTDYAVRDHGYMVYDTLFSMDDKEIQSQKFLKSSIKIIKQLMDYYNFAFDRN